MAKYALFILFLVSFLPVHGLDVFTDVKPEMPQASESSGFENVIFEDELRETLLQHERAVAGTKAITDLKALVIRGVWIQGEKENPFVVKMMRPHYYRLEIQLDGVTHVQVYDGNWGWFMQNDDGVRQVRWMSERESAKMKRDSLFLSYLTEWQRESVELNLLSSGNRNYIKVQARLDGGEVILYHLDSETYLIDEEIKQDARGSGFRVLKYSDYRDVEGYQFAHLVKHYYLGTLEAELRIEAVELVDSLSVFQFTAPMAEKPPGYTSVEASEVLLDLSPIVE